MEPVTDDGLGCGLLVLEIPRHYLEILRVTWRTTELVQIPTFGPEKQSSPSSPVERMSPVSRLTTFILETKFRKTNYISPHLMLGRSCPEEPMVSRSLPLVKVMAGPPSVIPKPSLNLTLGAFLWNKSIRP